MENEKKLTFQELYDTDCVGHIETKPTGKGGKLSYLSWAFAWATLQKYDSSANYEIVKTADDDIIHKCNGNSAYVEVKVTAFGKTIDQILPVMDNRNNAMPLTSSTQTDSYGNEKFVEALDSFSANTSIQRCLTKAIAMFGLGLKLYAGEDLPCEDDGETPQNGTQTPRQATGASSGGNYAPLPQNASVGPKNVAMASLKQIGLLKKLMGERNLADISGKQPDELTSEEASKAIDELTASPKADDNAKLHARIKAVLTGGLSTKATAEFLDFLSKKGYGSEADVSDTRTLLALANNLEEKLAKEKAESVKPLSDDEMPF